MEDRHEPCEELLRRAEIRLREFHEEREQLRHQLREAVDLGLLAQEELKAAKDELEVVRNATRKSLLSHVEE